MAPHKNMELFFTSEKAPGHIQNTIGGLISRGFYSIGGLARIKGSAGKKHK
jgi:hypothetical protein